MAQYCKPQCHISLAFSQTFGNNNASYTTRRDGQRSGDKLAVATCAAEYRNTTYSHYSSVYNKNCSSGSCTTPSTSYTSSANWFNNGKA